MPHHTDPDDCIHPVDVPGEAFSLGICTRTWIATQLMQGMLANCELTVYPHEILAQDAVQAANKLIEALNREQE